MINVIYIIIGCISAIAMGFMVVILFNTLKAILTVMKVLSSQQPKISMLTYPQLIQVFDKIIKKNFERCFITNILPELATESGNINRAIPDSNSYTAFITSVLLQINENLDEYIKKNLVMHGFTANKINEYIVLEVKRLLDSELVKHMVILKQNGSNNIGALSLLMKSHEMSMGKKPKPQQKR